MNYIVVVMPRRIDENGSTELFELAGVFVWGVAYIGSTVTTESDGFTTMVATKTCRGTDSLISPPKDMKATFLLNLGGRAG